MTLALPPSLSALEAPWSGGGCCPTAHIPWELPPHRLAHEDNTTALAQPSKSSCGPRMAFAAFVHLRLSSEVSWLGFTSSREAVVPIRGIR